MEAAAMFRKISVGLTLFVGMFLPMGTTYAMSFGEYSSACANNGGSAYVDSRGIYQCSFSGGGSGSGSNYDYQAAQAAAEAARLAEEQRKREAELEQQRKDADEKRRKEEIEKNARFLRDRNEAAGTLRGSTGTTITPNTSGGSVLRGSSMDTGIRNLKPATETRDLGGSQAAWKQLNCAAAISAYAFAALAGSDTRGKAGDNDFRKPDYDEFRNLANEASKALNGEQLGVQCPSAPAAPDSYGRGGYERYTAKLKAKLEQAKKLADDLMQARTKRKDALDRLVEVKTTIAERKTNSKAQSELDKLREIQARLNEQQSDKYAALRDEQRKLNAENDRKLEDVRQKQREINDANKRQTNEMKKSALAEALAAQRAAQIEYDKSTRQEAVDAKKLDEIKKTVDRIANGDLKVDF